MDFQFSFENARVERKMLAGIENSLSDYSKLIKTVVDASNYEALEASLILPQDKSHLEMVKKLVAEKASDKLKFVLVIGIGGSNLGTVAVYESIFGNEYNFTRSDKPRLLFLDTTAPKKAKAILNILDSEVTSSEEMIINVISKSGGTTETMAGLELVYAKLKPKFADIQERVVFTTDEGSKLWVVGEQKGISLLSIPKLVGGRYSVLSAVGLFPLMLAGVDAEELLAGALEMRDSCMNAGIEQNYSMLSAGIAYHYWAEHLRISNSFFFNPEMESVGKWYRQLMGESIGKSHNLDGEEVHVGITPIVTIGSTDLHSMAQLYFGGPRDKFTTIIYSSQTQIETGLPDKLEFDGLVEGIAGKNFAKIMDAIVGGVKAAYLKNELPFMEIGFKEINAHSVGAFLQFKMLEKMYLAKLLNVNAFDQPNVEDYKTGTKKLLV